MYLNHQGSVRRARAMLEAGMREDIHSSESDGNATGSGSRPSHGTRWPFADESFEAYQSAPYANNVSGSSRLPIQNALPPSSVHPERVISEIAPSPLKVRKPVPSFSQPFQHHYPSGADYDDASSRATTADETPRISIATDELFRESVSSSIASIPEFHYPSDPVEYQECYDQAPPSPVYRLPVASRVSPIPEESSESPSLIFDQYPSSHEAPSNRGDGQETWGTHLEDDSDETAPENKQTWVFDSPVVRQVSIGSKMKPSVLDIQKRKAGPSMAQKEPTAPVGAFRLVPPVASKTLGSSQPNDKDNDEGKSASFSPASSTDSSSALYLEKARFVLENEGTPIKAAHLEKANEGFRSSEKRSGGHRPPRLDIDAVRQAEARGSLTSLPDLIRRATKLASNLEHGKTASRLYFFENSSDSKPSQRSRRSGSISDLLNSFPNPKPAGPGTSGNRPTSWSTLIRSSINEIREDHGADASILLGTRRRCCGMPTWLFALICVVIVLVVAAAIIVPLILVVLPHEQARNRLTPCEEIHPCRNGGASVQSGDLCSCVCTNDFTGSHCTISGDSSCVTADVASRNVTLGSDLPRLFAESEETYNIPLDSTTILALFSEGNVSCTTENALVSFAGVSTAARRSLLQRPPIFDEPSKILRQATSITAASASFTKTNHLVRKGTISTTDGILVDVSSSTPSSSASTVPTSTSVAPMSTASYGSLVTPTSTPNSTSSTVTPKILDFARIAVLFIFEQTGTLTSASKSEEAIQTYLTGMTSTSNMSLSMNMSDMGSSALSGSVVVNFLNFTITLPNGTVVGG